MVVSSRLEKKEEPFTNRVHPVGSAEVVQRKAVRSVSRGKDPGKLSCGKEAPKCRDSGDERSERSERRSARRSVSAQPMRECRHKEPFDCSAKIGPSLGVRDVHRGVAKALLKSSSKLPADSFSAKKSEFSKPLSKATKQDSSVETESSRSVSVSSEITQVKQVVAVAPASAHEMEEVSSKLDSEGRFSTTLHKRLAMLEGKVSQLASELKVTKELLHASNPINMQVLSDIQQKISNIEKAIVSKANDVKKEACNEPPPQETRLSLSSLEKTDSDCRKSNAVSRHKTVEERLLPHLMIHQKLVESRAALQQKLVENKALLRSKIAALDGSDVENGEGDVIAAEFLASLNQSGNGGESDIEMVKSLMSGVVPSKFIDVENLSPKDCGKAKGTKKCTSNTRNSAGGKDSSEKKRRHCETLEEDSSALRRSSGSYKSANTSASDVALDASAALECDELLSNEAAENQENTAPVDIPVLEAPGSELCQLGTKGAMAGWFVYEAEGVLLAHEDGSCSFYDVANMEEKTQYKAPEGLAPATWRDCWLIRAAGSDGRSNKYVVAASAGSAVDPAFCSWNFHDKTVAAYHSETPSWPTTPTTGCSSRTSPDLSPESTKEDTMSLSTTFSRGSFRAGSSSQSRRLSNKELDFPLWWYRPCGPLIASGGSGLRGVTLYDIRDGDLVMKWESSRCLETMGYSSPIQWRSRSTILTAEVEGISIWDISNSEAQCVNNVDLTCKCLRAVHTYNTDGECNGGVRQRISSNDSGGIDGVFATQEAVNILDVRVPSGVALKIPIFGQNVHSLYAHGDSVYAGGTTPKKPQQCTVQQWSIRKGQPMLLYTLPDSAASHHSHTEISQVWGNSDYVMAVNGNGLFVFDATSNGDPKAVIGSDDLYSPSFDYSGTKLLLISKDRPASWQYWPTTHTWSL